MTDWTYTRKEKQAINKAFDRLTYIASSLTWHHETRLIKGMRYEKRERSSLHSAKALCVRAFLDGRDKDPKASEIDSESPGLWPFTMFGAACRVRFVDSFNAEDIATLEAGVSAHRSFIDRNIERVTA